VQVLGAEQLPPFWQAFEQLAKLQVEPCQPFEHWQVLDAVHWPLTHEGLHGAIKENIRIILRHSQKNTYTQ